ncbi:hypothetical protein [Streptomyces xiaopingdaonensis]|uniref:hypothetical protein n=1 Tax=Streptomyces xiaopingdaonensis TaxID=1565415 RepID=UPI0002F6A184|nr:hypothetical protein [Streptomyces xiaopingdaonensis]
MTAENNGSGSAPEGDDPFAYLYRQEGAAGSAGQTASQPGVPRRSYNQVRAVGERQYGQAQSGAPGPAQQPNAHYAAPETMPGGRAAARQEGQPQRGGRNRTGLLIGAIAVVAAVVVGIGAAVLFNNDESAPPEQQAGSGQTDQPSEEEPEQDTAGGDDKKPPQELPKEDAATLRLDGGAVPAKDVADAQARGGTYVGGMDKPGASVTWELKDIPKDGKYTLFVRYGVPGEDADATLAVNGKPSSQKLNLSNFAGADKGEWDKGWTRTFSWIDLKKGENAVTISCGDGNTCNFNLDQMWLKGGWVKQ